MEGRRSSPRTTSVTCHRGVVHHHGELVGGDAVGARHHEVAHRAGHVDAHCARGRVLEGDRARAAPGSARRAAGAAARAGRLAGREVAAGPRVARPLVGRAVRRLRRRAISAREQKQG